MQTITIEAELVLLQFRKTAFVFTEYPVKILGIRGNFLEEGQSAENDMGIYDDLIVAIIGNQVTGFRASTDPGWYYINHPVNPKGCAQLQPGLWWYEAGLHHGHQAFVQSDAVGVNRLDEKGSVIEREIGWFGINIHSGGPEYRVGRYSAGCQVINSPQEPWGEAWRAFYDPIIKSLAQAEQRRIPYLLVDKLTELI